MGVVSPWERSRIGLVLAGIPPQVLWAAVGAVTALRLAYAVLVADPMSGPDADTYRAAAESIAQRGYFASDVPGVPYWPSGYPLVLSILVLIAPDQWLVLAEVVQVLALSGASVVMWLLAKSWAGPAVANLSLLMALLLPVFMASAPLLMYETLLGCMVLFGIAAACMPFLNRDVSTGRRTALGLAAGLAFGVATIIQPKSSPLLVIALIILVVRKQYLASLMTSITAIALVGIVVVRNYVVHDWIGISYNVGINMILYNENRASACVGVGGAFDADRDLAVCSLLSDLRSPDLSIPYTIRNGVYFLWPNTGPRTTGSSWFHGLDLRRFLFGPVDSPPVRGALDGWVNPLLAVTIAALFVTGLVAARRLNRSVTVLLAAPAITFLASAMIIFGEGRQRIPVLLTSVPIASLGLIAVGAFVGERLSTVWTNRRRTQQSTASST